MTQVMISYRRKDHEEAFAKELNAKFKDAGIDTWLDIDRLTGGYSWKNKIIEAIKQSDYVAVCLSEEYFKSPICMTECYIAQGYRKKILPIWVSKNREIDPWSGLLNQHAETQGLEYKMIANLYLEDFWGLSLSYEERVERVIQAVANPLPQDNTYDVYVSYRYDQAEYAASIASALNEKGKSTFAMPISINVGDDMNETCWNAMLQSKYHLVIMSHDIVTSNYIRNELRATQTKETRFMPVLNEHLSYDAADLQITREQLQKDEDFRILTEIGWFRQNDDFTTMIDTLVTFIDEASASP